MTPPPTAEGPNSQGRALSEYAARAAAQMETPTEPTDPPPETCITVKCSSGFHCEDTVTGGVCVADSVATCATVKCSSGFHCEDTATGGMCVADITCANFNCLIGTCVDTPTGPICVTDDPCAAVKCSAGNHCDSSSGGAMCVPDVCPLPACAAPPIGCTYQGGNVSGPCDTWTCGTLICTLPPISIDSK